MKIVRSLILLVAVSFAPLVASQPVFAEGSTPAVVPVFRVDRPLAEAPVGEDLMLFGGGAVESFEQWTARLRKVRDDEKVKAIVLLGNGAALGHAQLQETLSILKEIKEAGKEIHSHAESLTTRSHAVHAVANRLSVVPNGDIWLTGLFGASMHVRGLLDKLEVEPDFLTCGDYKSAAETYTRKEPSPEAEENLRWLLDDLFAMYVEMIAEGRETSEEQVQQWMDKGLFSPDAAQELGIIDAVEDRDEFIAELKSRFGEDLKFDKKYGKKKPKQIDLSSPFGVLKFYADLLSGPSRPGAKKDAVGIVYVEGPIMAGEAAPGGFPFGAGGIAYSGPIRKALLKAADDDSIKAVVLRVNSPGGSAVGSEVILQATLDLREKKPFVVSMGDVAGSGGYYVACGTDTIFADPATITASIGVVAGKLATRDMWEKFGVNFKEFEQGPQSGILSSNRAFTPAQREMLQSWMDEIYDVFKQHVLNARRERLTKDLEDMAGGRVYTGRQALDLGLVDRLGGLRDAVAHAAELADLEDYDVRPVPRPKNFAELLTESLSGEDDQDQPLSLNAPSGLGEGSSDWLAKLAWPRLRKLDPATAGHLKTALRQLEILQQENVSLPMPQIILRDGK